jgi:hypothetical protein
MRETDAWTIICLELASDDPVRSKAIKEACTYTEIAVAWQNNRRKTEGVGYKIKDK